VFNDVISLTLEAFYSTYFICVVLLLYRRLGSTIHKANASNPPTPAKLNQETGEYELTWGPWHVPGWLGIINNVIACVYLVTIWFFGFFPPATPVVASTMNYSSLMFGATVLYSTVYYLIWGKKQYNGPVVEIVI
jgi:choline transport protein